MAKQNIFDNEVFFSEYRKLRERDGLVPSPGCPVGLSIRDPVGPDSNVVGDVVRQTADRRDRPLRVIDVDLGAVRRECRIRRVLDHVPGTLEMFPPADSQFPGPWISDRLDVRHRRDVERDAPAAAPGGGVILAPVLPEGLDTRVVRVADLKPAERADCLLGIPDGKLAAVFRK